MSCHCNVVCDELVLLYTDSENDCVCLSISLSLSIKIGRQWIPHPGWSGALLIYLFGLCPLPYFWVAYHILLILTVSFSNYQIIVSKSPCLCWDSFSSFHYTTDEHILVTLCVNTRQKSSRISLVMDYTYHLVLCLRFLMALSSPVAYSLFFFLTLSGGPPLFNLLESSLCWSTVFSAQTWSIDTHTHSDTYRWRVLYGHTGI